MIPEDAIWILELIRNRDARTEAEKDAVNAAIEALKAQLSREGTTSDMISREAVIDLLKQMRKDGDMVPWEGKNVFARIRKLPSAQPEPKEGHWILYDKRFPWRTWYKCSECGNYLDFSGVNGGRGEVNFCPNCGADMRGKQNEL